MFSGIVEEAASIDAIHHASAGCELRVKSGLDHQMTQIGDSIAINGVCLTVVKKDGSHLSFDLAEETLRKTNLGALTSGDCVNLERSLALGDRLHGHFVFGHVDGVGTLKDRMPENGSERLRFSYPESLRPFLATKGSISISGVSLTLGEIEDDSFSVYIIPHTADITTLGTLRPGDSVNLEVDMLARYVVSAVGYTPRDERIKNLLTQQGRM